MTSLSRGDKAADPLRLRRNEAVRAAANRRRRMTFGLLGLVAISTVASFFGYCPVPVVIGAYVVLIGWLALAVRAASALSRPAVAATSQRPVAVTPRPRYVTPTPAWGASAAQSQFFDESEVEPSEEFLEATGTDGQSWAPVPHQVPHNVRASGVSGEIIARASSWSKAVLDDVRARTSTPQRPDTYEGDRTPISAPPAAPAQPQNVYLEEDPPTAEIPIIRHAAGA
jgi:hypothetical protein